jgi:hypothetical protein
MPSCCGGTQKNPSERHDVKTPRWWVAVEKNREFPNFADDTRNLRFVLNIDDVNSFGEQGCCHNTWHVACNLYHLPSSQKYWQH